MGLLQKKGPNTSVVVFFKISIYHYEMSSNSYSYAVIVLSATGTISIEVLHFYCS